MSGYVGRERERRKAIHTDRRTNSKIDEHKRRGRSNCYKISDQTGSGGEREREREGGGGEGRERDGEKETNRKREKPRERQTGRRNHIKPEKNRQTQVLFGGKRDRQRQTS